MITARTDRHSDGTATAAARHTGLAQPARMLTGAEVALESLIREGVDTIFGYPGGANLWLYRYLPEYPQLNHVLVRHEQGGAHAADGYARSKRGSVGVVFATSGPGALNLVTGLATAYVTRSRWWRSPVRCRPPRSARTASRSPTSSAATMSVVKHSYLITTAEDIAPTIKEAFHIARTGRPGPVLIDFPKDLQAATTAFNYPERSGAAALVPRPTASRPREDPPDRRPHRGRQAPGDPRRPGRPHRQARRRSCSSWRTGPTSPVGWTLLGTGAFPVTDPMALQMVGFMGAGYTNKAVCDADVLIMIGMRCDDRVTTRLDSFAPQVEHLIHIDIDPAEIGKNVVPHVERRRRREGRAARAQQARRAEA